MKKNFNVIIVPSLQKEIDRIRDRGQIRLIQKSFDKIERHGKTAI